MAIITRIRKHASILVVLIGFSMAGFVLMSALDSDFSLLRGKKNQIGKIDGEEITIQEFEKKYQETIENYKLNTNQKNLDEQTNSYLRDQTWNQFVQDILVSKQYNKLGVMVTGEELFNLVQGPNPHPMIKQASTNPQTGVFDAAQVLLYLKNMDNDQTGDARKRWLAFENQIKKDRTMKKYQALVSKGFYVPKWQADNEFENRNQTASIKFLQIPYSSIDDKSVKISDNDLEGYLKAHSNRYKQEESRSIEYVAFDVKPSAEDTAKAEKIIVQQLEDFKKSDNDSVFIRLNSDEEFKGDYLTKSQLVSMMTDSIFKSDTGKFIGPYQENGEFIVAKIAGKKLIPDSVKASHLLIKVEQGQNDEAAKHTIDSLKTLIQKGAKFDSITAKNSQDLANASRGGDLGWIKPGEMVPEFNSAIFYEGKEGDLMTVKTQFGWHLIRINQSKKSTPAVKIVFLKKKITASGQTERAIFAKANEFAGKYRTPEEFDKAATEQNLGKRKTEQIKKNDFMIMGLGQAREAIKWVYNSAKGDISNVFALEDKFVIVHIIGVKNEGIASVEDIRPELEIEVRKEKKAEIIGEKINKAKGVTIEEIAKAMDVEVKTSNNISFAGPFIPGIGQEPKVVGAIFGMKEKSVSKPIHGNTGVFVVFVETILPAPQNMDVTQYQKSLQTSYQQRADREIFETLKKSTDITDNRSKFY